VRELTLRRRTADPPDPSLITVERLLIASEGLNPARKGAHVGVRSGYRLCTT